MTGGGGGGRSTEILMARARSHKPWNMTNNGTPQAGRRIDRVPEHGRVHRRGRWRPPGSRLSPLVRDPHPHGGARARSSRGGGKHQRAARVEPSVNAASPDSFLAQPAVSTRSGSRALITQSSHSSKTVHGKRELVHMRPAVMAWVFIGHTVLRCLTKIGCVVG